MGIGTALVIFLLAMAMQALFAGYETGFVSTNPIRVRYLAEQERQRRAQLLLRYLSSPGRMLTTLLLGTNLAVVGGTIAVSGQFERIELPAELREVFAALVVAPMFLVFSEIIPKSVFRTHPNRLTMALLPVIRVFYELFGPLAAPIAWVTGLMMRTVGGQAKQISPLMTSLEDVRMLVDESVEQGTIQREEQRMIHSVIELHSTQAREIMTPRIQIQALPDTATPEELLALFEKTGLTRAPIYHETIDAVIGVANAHDVLLDADLSNPDIIRFVREVVHVPDTMKVDDLFQVMKRGKHHVAVVVDEYGGTDGLITIEDILEEIFGEIQDEHDAEERPIQKVGASAYVVDARTALGDLARVIGREWDDAEVDTVGGWVMHVAGRIPAQGEVIEERGLRMTVLAGGPNHVAKIRLELTGDPGGADAHKL